MNIIEEISENLRRGEAIKTGELVQKAADNGLSCNDILDKGLFSGMQVVGKLFAEEEIFLPELLMAAKAMDSGIKVLQPIMEGSHETKRLGKIVIGTVKGDVHDLGKKLVGIMLRGAGFDVIDIGVDRSEQEFVKAIISENPQLVGMSALLTTTMPYMKSTIDAIKESGLEEKVKTIIGGACVTQQYAEEIGADSYAENAGIAVQKVKELLKLE